MTWRRTHIWGELTRAELAEARDAGALPVLAIGSCEQHADHLPVDTDILLAHSVALKAAETATDVHALILPPLGYGFSPHHQTWPGTVTWKLSTILAVLTDIAESLHRTGWDRLLIVNGHGGNDAPIWSLCTELVSRGIRVGGVSYFEPSRPAWTPGLPGARKDVGHACAFETAMVLALRPEDRQRVLSRTAGLPPRLLPAWLDQPTNPFEAKGLWYAALFPPGDSGYIGDPAEATVEAGEALLTTLVSGLADFYAAFATAKIKVGT